MKRAARDWTLFRIVAYLSGTNHGTTMMNRISFLSFLLLLFCLSCGGGGGDDARDQVPESDDDDVLDDDDTGGADDDDTADDDDDEDVCDGPMPDCGGLVTVDTCLTADLDCSGWGGDYVLTIDATGIVFDCDGHRIIAPEDAFITIFSDEDGDVTIQNCELSQGDVGIHVKNNQGLKVLNNTIHDVDIHGIWLINTAEVEVTGNQVFGDQDFSFGIELYSASGGVVTENTVSGAVLGGIQFYGSDNLQVFDNLVYQVGDTCFGFFSDTDTGNLTHSLEVFNNEAYECNNVGANEIMFGSFHLDFYDNLYHDVANGFTFYQGPGAHMKNITIENNQIIDAETGISISEDTEWILIDGNEFNRCETPFVLYEAENLFIRYNLIQYEAKNPPEEPLLTLDSVTDLEFNHNVIQDYTVFVRLVDYANVDLAENYWNGCPDLRSFTLDKGPYDAILPFINPVNSLPCHEVDPPIDLVDGNGDGFDDENCERAFEIECLD